MDEHNLGPHRDQIRRGNGQMPLLAPLRHHPFFWLWSGQTISRLGDQLYTIALAWFVLSMTHSATARSVVLVAALVPNMLFVLIGGAVADRLPRLAIMLASDLVRGVLVIGVALLTFTGSVPLWLIISMSFCFGLVDAFFLPAYRAVIPQVIPMELLAGANALMVLSGRSMAIAGPSLGAILIVIGGIPVAFAINGLSFFLSAICLVKAIALLPELARKKTPASIQLGPRERLAQMSADIREGLVTVRSMTWLWLTIVLLGVANLFAEAATVVTVPFYVQQTLKSPFIYGAMGAASAVGGILGAIWTGVRKVRHRGIIVYGFFFVAMLVPTIIGIFPYAIVIPVAMFIYSLSATILGLVWVKVLQEYIPNEQMGRVTSIDELGSSIGLPLSLVLTGIFTDHFDARQIIIWGGVSGMAITALGFLSKSVRTLD